MVIKVKPWGKDQGDYVLIEEENLTPDMERYDEPAKRGRPFKDKEDKEKGLE